jgi:hypothetical protein
VSPALWLYTFGLVLLVVGSLIVLGLVYLSSEDEDQDVAEWERWQ